MARIRPLDPDEVGPETRALFESFQRERGNIPNMTRTMAYQPALAATAAAHLRAVMETGMVERRLKEMLAVRVSQVNQCYYWMASHTALAKQMGVPPDLLDAMYHIDEHRDRFTEAEQAALRLAEVLTTDPRGVDDEIWATLREHYDAGRVVEIVAVVGLFNYFNRFNEALGVEPTIAEE